MEIFKDIIGYLKKHKSVWMIPILVSLILLTFLTFFATGAGVAPFIYTLF